MALGHRGGQAAARLVPAVGLLVVGLRLILLLVQRRTLHLPSALFSILALRVLFGPLGILLATPLTVVLFVAMKQLYVQDALGENTSLPGERS